MRRFSADTPLSLATANAFFYPVGTGDLAHIEGRLDRANATGAFVIGALLMVFPIVTLRLRDKSYFRQG